MNPINIRKISLVVISIIAISLSLLPSSYAGIGDTCGATGTTYSCVNTIPSTAATSSYVKWVYQEYRVTWNFNCVYATSSAGVYQDCGSTGYCSNNACVDACAGAGACKTYNGDHTCSANKPDSTVCGGTGYCIQGSCEIPGTNCIAPTVAGNPLTPTITRCCLDSTFSSGGKCYKGTTCLPGDVTFCPNNQGVCAGSTQVCDSTGQWPGCSAAVYSAYSSEYQASEIKCDRLDNNCDGAIDFDTSANYDSCERTNLLFFNGSFTSCNLGTYSATPIPTIWYKLSSNFQFAYDQKSFLPSSHPFNPVPKSGSAPSQSDITNVAQACKNLGSYYCDTFATFSQWGDAFKFSSTKLVDSVRAIDAVGGVAWPQTYWNSTITNTTSAPNFTQTQQCCPSSFCNDGTSCVDSALYTNNTKLPPIFMAYGQTGYRCGVNGNWSIVSPKQDYYKNDTGYCTLDTDCYVDAKSPCLQSGQWTQDASKNDRFCYNGVWTTRTRYIATALLNYTQEKGITNFVLYCDVVNNALGENFEDMDYVLNTTAPKFKQFVKDSNYCAGKDCINNVCVLKFNDKVILGTSLNSPLNTSSYPLQLAFGFQNPAEPSPTTPQTGDEINLIYKSSASGKLFYSQNKQVIFYSDDDSIANFDTTFLEDVGYAITNPISSILNFVTGLFNPLQSTQILSKVNDFDKVYVARSGSKVINGLQETKVDNSQTVTVTQTLLSINYTGFTGIDICTPARNKGLGCNASSNSQYVYDIRSTVNPYDNIWQDLTSKLRIN